jgi:hypothetical protein
MNSKQVPSKFSDTMMWQQEQLPVQKRVTPGRDHKAMGLETTDTVSTRGVERPHHEAQHKAGSQCLQSWIVPSNWEASGMGTVFLGQSQSLSSYSMTVIGSAVLTEIWQSGLTASI